MFDFIDFRGRKKNGYHSNVSPCTVYPQNIQCVAKIDKHNEHAIYHFMQSIPLGTIAPKYYGLWEAHDRPPFPKKDQERQIQADGNFNYIIMEDLMKGFKNPNFVDIKLGTRTSDVKTKKRSIDRLAFLVASTTSADFGFRITDILNSKNKKDKKAQRREIASNIFETSNFFKSFFSTHQLKSVYDQLKNIRNVIILTLHQFPGFRIYASSVFITYDSEAPEKSEVRVKLIDFAHTHFDVDKDDGDRNALQYDDGVLRGLDSLILLTGLILSERKVPLGHENLVDPEKMKEKEEKKLKKSGKTKDKTKQDKDGKKSKDKEKSTDNKCKDKDTKKEKNAKSTKTEGQTQSAKYDQKLDLEINSSAENNVLKEQLENKNQITTNTKNMKAEINQKNVKQNSDITNPTNDKETDESIEIEEEEEEEANSEKDEDSGSINLPLDSESFNDRQPDSDSDDN